MASRTSLASTSASSARPPKATASATIPGIDCQSSFWFHILSKITADSSNSEAWRYKGQFSRFNRFKNALPGLGTASVAFAGYCLYEYLFIKDEHHAEGHGEEHH